MIGYTEAINLDPNYADAYTSRGVAKYKLDRYEEAIEDYNLGIQISPSALLYNNRAYCEYKLKQYDKALADYDKAFSIDNNFALAHLNIAKLYSEWKDKENALRHLTKAIQFEPSYKEDIDETFNWLSNDTAFQKLVSSES